MAEARSPKILILLRIKFLSIFALFLIVWILGICYFNFGKFTEEVGYIFTTGAFAPVTVTRTDWQITYYNWGAIHLDIDSPETLMVVSSKYTVRLFFEIFGDKYLDEDGYSSLDTTQTLIDSILVSGHLKSYIEGDGFEIDLIREPSHNVISETDAIAFYQIERPVQNEDSTGDQSNINIIKEADDVFNLNDYRSITVLLDKRKNPVIDHHIKIYNEHAPHKIEPYYYDWEWEWNITPIDTGLQYLSINVEALINNSGDVINRDIMKTGRYYYLKGPAKQSLNIVRFAKNNIQVIKFVWISLILPFVGFLWRSYKKRSKKIKQIGFSANA